MDLEIEERPLRGEFLRIGKVVNTMVDQLGSFASEVTRVAREVGTEGKLGGQAQVKGVAGTWKDLTDNVNSMAANLTGQVRNIAEVTTAVANGDLSKKITVDVKGEMLELKNTINTMVDQLNSFASEVTRVAREVGTEGKLGGQAQVKGVAGTWKDLTDNVNLMAANLTGQVRNIAEVTTAVAKGDLSKKITVDVQGEILELKNTINTMVDQLNSFASEVTRVAREVGTEGKLGGQAQVEGVAGTWKDLTDNVNFMAANLTGQVRNIAEVTTAVAKGDLSKKITVDVKGEILELKNTINTMVDQLNAFASEVTRVAREVGTEGKLGGQAKVKGVGRHLEGPDRQREPDGRNLTGQVRNIAEVTTAVANGDLSKKITVDVHGEILELKNTINTMVDQLNSFASEVTRVAREVGTEGKLGGQAQVKGVAGTWKDLTDNVNLMAANLTGQVRNIAEVTTAVANGDLSKKITVDVKGEILELKNTINTMVDQLNSFASEVTRVAREVGTEGKLGGQAQVKGVAGTWKDLTDNVNFMAGNLTGQVRNIAEVTTAVANGDLSKKITVDVRGEILELKNTINTMVDQLNSFASEVTRVAREVGTEGKLGGQAQVNGVAGTWKDLTDNVNLMAGNLTGQVRNIADVTTAVAKGDLSKKITVDVQGEILELKNTINIMVDQLNSFASEVTRVAREVGTEGKLGGQAQVPGVAGTWKDLTDNVNLMAANLTGQVRGIADVVTAVANGDLKRKLTLDAKGEIAALADTINGMIETLATFADQVTNVAREVGIEGKLGGQARVPGAAGLWRDLTDNVNQLAANLTTQVRAIAEVSTAVTKGDLTRSITVEASGEVAELKDNINEMIRNLQRSDAEEHRAGLAEDQPRPVHPHAAGRARPVDGVEPGAVRAGAAGQRPARASSTSPTATRTASTVLNLAASYAFNNRKHLANSFKLREGLIGQCAYEKSRILLTNVPQGLRPDQLGPGRGRAAEHHRAAGPVRRRGEGGDRAGHLRRVQRDPPALPRPADGIHRHRAQHHRRQHADRGPAEAVAAADLRAAGAAGGAEEDQRPAGAAGRVAAPVRGAAAHQAGGAAADQRRAGGEGAPAVGPEPAGGSQEPRGRAGQARARGQGRAAGADLEVQVRVPGQHEPRAAHAAEQPADPVQAAGRQRPGQPDRQAGRVRPQHPRRRRRPAGPDQRHPRPVQDRDAARSPWTSARCRSPACATRSTAPSRQIAAGQEARLRRSSSTRPCRGRCTPTTSGCSRSSRTCCRTPSSSPRRAM